MADADLIQRLNGALEGRYRIEGELGAGGMATVYRAEDLKHERKVALKVLKPELAAVVGADRFLAEIKTTANLQHPHILPLHDSGEVDGFLFYVMPYVEGESLRERLDRERQLPVEEAVRIVTSIAEALDYAHSRGVIHRDIKPANILIQAGKPVVSDFGIALAVTAAGEGRLTETGLSLGTPHYMSPEQATGEAHVGPASDIYALGCVLYEMLVGEPPYTGSTAQAVLGKIVTGDPDRVTKHRRSVPSNVDAAIRKALEKVPADRFAGAGELAQALDDRRFSYGPQAEAPEQGLVRRWKRTAGAAIAFSIVLAAALVRTSMSEPDVPRLARLTVPPPEGVRDFSRCCGRVQALSPDGQALVFVGLGGGEGRDPLFRRRLGELGSEEIEGTGDASIPFFSPDGAWVGYHSGGRLWKVRMDGGPPLPVTETSGRADGASWGEGDVIAFGDRDTLFTVPASGGPATPVPGTGGQHFHFPAFIPGGRAVLATARTGEPAEARVVLIDLETGRTDTLAYGTRAEFSSGHIVFSTADGTLLAQRFDPSGRTTSGDAVALVDGVRLAGPPQLGEFALSGRGDLVYQPQAGAPEGDSLLIVHEGGRAYIPLPRTGDLEDPAFSPDGQKIALRLQAEIDQADIWIFDRQQETFLRLTVDPSMNALPLWTRDGRRLAFASNRRERMSIYWMASDGTGPAEPLLESGVSVGPQSWFPDEQRLVFAGQRARGGSWDIGSLSIGDSVPEWMLVSEFDEIHPQVSRDGEWLAFSSNLSGEFEVYVRRLDEGGRRYLVSTDGGTSPRWAPDRDVLYYVSDATLTAASYTVDGGFRVTGRTEVYSGLTDVNLESVNYDVHPDGGTFIVIGEGARNQPTSGFIWILNWPELMAPPGMS